MQVFQDSDTAVPVRWFRCPPGAKPWPGYHRFASRDWDTDHSGTAPLGEVTYYPRPWANWIGPINVASDKYCGQFNWFQQGAPVAEAGQLERGDRWVPLCCLDGQVGWGGVEAGGNGAVTTANVFASTGGAEIGGTGTASTAYVITASGGLEASGTSAIEVAGEISAVGGVEVSGSALTLVTAIVEGLGGVEVGGTAELVTTSIVASTGGVEIGGTSAIVATITLVASGGVEIGGTAELVTISIFASTGGVEIGGTAVIDTWYEVELERQGNLIVNGTSDMIDTIDGSLLVTGETITLATSDADLLLDGDGQEDIGS